MGLLLIGALIASRNRREYRASAKQSTALTTQLEQLRAEQRQVAVLDERSRLAAEFQDVLAHSLAGLAIHLKATQAVLNNHDILQAQALLEQAQRIASNGLIDTRRAIQALRGDITTRLDHHLTTLVECHRRQHQTAIDFQITGEPTMLTADASVALIRTT